MSMKEGLYVPVFNTVREHDKTYDLAEALGINRAHAIGHLVLFWHWMQANRPDGVLEKVRPAQVAGACLWEGDPKLLTDGLLAAGFLREGEGGWHVPGWRDGGGRIIQRRRKDATRKRDARARGPSADDPGVSTVDEMRGDERRGEKTRGEKTSPQTPQGEERITEGSKSKPSRRVPTAMTKAQLAEFEDWWDLYPRKVGKGAARKAWPRAVARLTATMPRERAIERLIAGARTYTAKCKREGADPKFVKHPPTWLNADGWDDEPEPDFGLGQGAKLYGNPGWTDDERDEFRRAKAEAEGAVHDEEFEQLAAGVLRRTARTEDSE